MMYRGWKHVKNQRSIPRIEVDAEGLINSYMLISNVGTKNTASFVERFLHWCWLLPRLLASVVDEMNE
jgi:hypothetical protein